MKTTTDLDAALAELGERLRAATVQVRTRGGNGSGVIWSADGLIVSNAHVVAGRARVELADGRVLPALQLARDARRDLALLRVEARDLQPLELRGDGPQPGELAIAFGHPMGITNAVSLGIVHQATARFVYADTRIAPGNSGGPLVDHAGRLLGVNSMVAGGLSLAIPAAAVARFVSAVASLRAA